ncbi:unnamed protein product [Heterobilharzia americana]|nr:unnamed protein product [Heterobilharzia americana]
MSTIQPTPELMKFAQFQSKMEVTRSNNNNNNNNNSNDSSNEASLREYITKVYSLMNETITVPVTFIRSFKYRTTFYLPLTNVLQSTTIKELFNRIRHEMKNSPSVPPPFKNYSFDALKIRHKAFTTKSGELLVDVDGDVVSDSSEETLQSLGIAHETEVAVFKMTDFLAQRNNPEFLW